MFSARRWNKRAVRKRLYRIEKQGGRGTEKKEEWEREKATMPRDTRRRDGKIEGGGGLEGERGSSD